MSGNLAAEYHYTDAVGRVVATKRRLEPKDFRWVVPQPDGSVVHGLNGGSQRDLPLYNLAVIVNAPPGAFIYYAEGKKDAENITALGLVGTTSPEGAGAKDLPPSRFEALRNRDVVLLADNDTPGREYMQRFIEVLAPLALSVRTLELPDLAEKEDVSDWLARGGTREALEAMARETPPSSYRELVEQGEGPRIADAIHATITRFVVLPDEAAVAWALWVLHCHAFDASEGFTPYMHITSPTRESGKSTLIDVVEKLVPEPLRADSASAAALYRVVDVGRGIGEPKGRPPMQFLDELDAVFNGGASKSESSEAMRGVLNSGFKESGRKIICDGDKNEPRAFATWCPKVLAGIGLLPDTLTSRSIPIPLARATREELKRLRPARAKELEKLSDLRGEAAAWAESAIPRLKSRDEPILGLRARIDDIWGPLLNIADDLGGDWPERARRAALALHAETGDSTGGRVAGTALLSDLRDLFVSDGTTYLTSSRLAELLRLMEGAHGLSIGRASQLASTLLHGCCTRSASVQSRSESGTRRFAPISPWNARTPSDGTCPPYRPGQAGQIRIPTM